MSKLIATLVAGFISLGAFAATTPVAPVAAPPATAKVAAEPAKDVKKTTEKAVQKTKEKAATPDRKSTRLNSSHRT